MAKESSVRVVVDTEVCEGHGNCEDVLPEVFEVGESGKAELLRQEVPRTFGNELAKAVRYCPTRAISVVEQ